MWPLALQPESLTRVETEVLPWAGTEREARLEGESWLVNCLVG